MRYLIALLVAGVFLTASADDPDYTSRQILGWVEWAVIQPDGPAVRFKAKLDTGAKTSSLHAEDVESFSRDGEDWVRFEVPLTDHLDVDPDDLAVDRLTFERPVVRTVRIKTHDDAEGEMRYVIELAVCVAGTKRNVELTLNDRAGLLYPVLLGRRFFENEIIIDPAYSFLAERECRHTKAVDLGAERGVDQEGGDGDE